jgi:hypothetical protein
MHRCTVLAMCSTLGFPFLTGCSEQREAAGQVAPEPTVEQKVSYVIRAKYGHTRGPCIKMGNAFAMPALDAFDVVEVLKGDFSAKWITVRFHTNHGPGYPQDLVVGNLYTLILTPIRPDTGTVARECERGLLVVIH